MEAGMLLRIIMIGAGVFLFGITVASLAKRRMTDVFCLIWELISVLLVLAGILLKPAGWNKYISFTGLKIILLIGFCLIYGAYFISARISELMRKNQELAMHVSLLEAEYEEIKEKLDKLNGEEQ